MIAVCFLASNRSMWMIECFQWNCKCAETMCFFATESALRWKPSGNMGFLHRPAQKASNGVEKSRRLIPLFESFVDIFFGLGMVWVSGRETPYGAPRRRVWRTVSSFAFWNRFKKSCGLCEQHSTRACVGIQHMAAPLLVQAENESKSFTSSETAHFQSRSFHRPVLEWWAVWNQNERGMIFV